MMVLRKYRLSQQTLKIILLDLFKTIRKQIKKKHRERQ